MNTMSGEQAAKEVKEALKRLGNELLEYAEKHSDAECLEDAIIQHYLTMRAVVGYPHTSSCRSAYCSLENILEATKVLFKHCLDNDDGN